MKRIASILLIIIYAVLTAGVAKSTHYCMDRVQSVAYFSHQAEGCFDNSTNRKMPCCEDELELIQLEDEHQSVVSIDIAPLWFTITPDWYSLEYTSLNIKLDDDKPFTVDPPPLEQEPAYIRFCSFTYYG